jgi:dipeptidyl aminopeptidase/acylaminoacyl peptidase
MMRAFVMMMALLPLFASAAPPTLEELLKPSENDNVIISPDGRYMAATLRAPDNNENRVILVVLDRETNKPISLLDPGEKSEVDRAWWANEDTLFLMNSWGGNFAQQYYLDPRVVSISVDGKRKRAFATTIVDGLIDDDQHILLEYCGKSTGKGCYSYVRKADNDGIPVGERLAESPEVDVDFFADNVGNILFCYTWDENDRQKLWRHDKGQWSLFNEEAQSGVEILPIGVSRNGASVFLRSERQDGPDVIEEYVLATGERKVVMSDPKLDPLYIVWSADGRQPIGAAYGTGVPRVRYWDPSDPDSKLLKRLESQFPEDAVSFQSGTRDGKRVIVSVRSDRDPGSYYLMDREIGRMSLVARIKPWLDPESLAKTEAISFKTGDGVELDGYLTMPTGDSTKPVPLVVMPHGGPFEIRDSWLYDEEVQVLATRGYAVLRVNFRGSAGRGRSFVRSGYRQWGKKIQDDIVDGVRWAIAQGRVDPDRICVWGSSFGGYSALMGAIREPSLYKCAISTAGITDLNVARRWGDTQRSRYGRSYLIEAVGDDPAELHEQSPVKHVGKLQAKLLLVHGEHDQRVPFEHARVMNAALVRADKPPETLFFQQETHGIYGQQNRLKYYGRILSFLRENIGQDTSR